MKKSKTILIGFILLWVVGFLVVWGFSLFKQKAAEKAQMTETGMRKTDIAADATQLQDVEAAHVRCYRAAPTDFKDELPVLGTVKGALEIKLRFEVNGVVEVIDFREGDIIYKGDLIASLDKKDAQLKVEYAKSKLESAKLQALAAKKKLEIHGNLYDIGGIIRAKLEEVELEARSAALQVKSGKVELKSAESEIVKTSLYAPRDGVLGSRDVEVGEFVTPHDKVATLYGIGEVFVELGIVEKDIDKITLGQGVSVTVDAYPGEVFTGVIDNVFPVIEGKSRTLTVRVRIENPDAMLLPGMFSRAMITVAEFSDAIVVPSLSLDRTDEGYKIFTVDEDNVVSARSVEVDYVTSDYTVIAFGIYEDDLVVVDSSQELKDGMVVNIIEVQESVLEE